MRRHGLCGVAAVFLLSASSPAQAASSEWISHDGGRLRVVAGAPDEDGTIRAILDVELEPGWKTYWRDPGQSGLPPALDIGGSDNLASARLLFPPPERVDDGYAVWSGYTRSVRLPLVLQQDETGQASALSGDLMIGVCEKVCIPVQASLTLDLDRPPAPVETALIDQAFETLPQEPDATMGIEVASLTDDGASLTVEARLPSPASASDAELFIAAPDGWRIGVPKRAGTDGSTARFMAKVKARPTDPASAGPLTLLLKTRTASVEQAILPD